MFIEENSLLTAKFRSRNAFSTPSLQTIIFFFSLCFCCGHMIFRIQNNWEVLFETALFDTNSFSKKDSQNVPRLPQPQPTDLSDPSVLEAATESLAKYNKERPLKLYALVKVTRASSQVRLRCPLPPTVCLRTCYRFLN